jgi:hypothetical protein
MAKWSTPFMNTSCQLICMVLGSEVLFVGDGRVLYTANVAARDFDPPISFALIPTVNRIVSKLFLFICEILWLCVLLSSPDR